MKLFSRIYGEGRPLIILHGLFGMGDNWASMAKLFSERNFCCYLVDQRNHGRSQHSLDFNYQVMATDMLQLMDEEQIEKAVKLIQDRTTQKLASEQDTIEGCPGIFK